MTEQTNQVADKLTLWYEELVQQHAGWILAMARRQLNDATMAEDATQAVFLALWQKRRHLVNGQRIVGGWLMQATAYACSNIRKTERRINLRQRKAAAMRREEVPLPEATAEAQCQQLLQLDAALQKLSTADRDVIVARYFQGQTAAQVAQQFHISIAAAEKRISRAVEKLRTRMTRTDVTLDNMAVATLLASGAGNAPPAELISRMLQQATGAAPINPAATHAARHIAFRSAHIPAIAGAAAVAMVAIIVPTLLSTVQSVHFAAPTAVFSQNGDSAAAQNSTLTCVSYAMLVPGKFARMVKTKGKLLPHQPGEVRAYAISARAIQSMAESLRKQKRVFLSSGSLHWLARNRYLPRTPANADFSIMHTFRRQRTMPSVFLNLFLTCRVHQSPSAMRLHVWFAKNSNQQLAYSGQWMTIPYVFNHTLKISGSRAVVLLKHALSYPGGSEYSAVVLDVERYPRKYLPVLHRFLSVGHYFSGGPAEMTKRAAVGYAWDYYAHTHPVSPQTGDGRWTRSLPDGARVQLLSIYSGTRPDCPWAPNGQPLNGLFYGGAGRGTSAWEKWSYALLDYQLPTSEVVGLFRGGPAGNGYREVNGSDIQLTHSILHVGLDSGKWRIIGTAKPTAFYKPNFTYRGKKLDVSNISQQAARPAPFATPAQITMTLWIPPGFTNHAIAVGIIDRQGHLVVPFSSFRRFIAGRGNAGGEYSNESIPGNLHDVQRYVWITRPIHWVTFRGFALKPFISPIALAGQTKGIRRARSSSIHAPKVGTVHTATGPSTPKVGAVHEAPGRATPNGLGREAVRYMYRDDQTGMIKLFYAPSKIEKEVVHGVVGLMAQFTGYGLWHLAKKRFGVSQLEAVGLSRSKLGAPPRPSPLTEPRWIIQGRFATFAPSPHVLMVGGLWPITSKYLIRRHGSWYMNFSNLTKSQLALVQKMLKTLKMRPMPNAMAYRMVVTELRDGKIKNASALKKQLQAAIKKYALPKK